MIEDDTSSEQELNQEVKISKVGYIEMRKNSKNPKKNTFKAVHCVLIGGSFYWFQDSKAAEPINGCALRDIEIENNVRIGNKDCFVFKNSEEEQIFVGHLTSETNRDAWVQFLNENKNNFEPQPPPSRTEVKNKKKNLMNRTKNKVVSKTATSALGKKVMKAIINEETTTLLGALKNIVRQESDNPKRAEDLEKNIIKIAVKAYLIIEKGKLDAEEFLKADRPLREAFELLSRCFSGRSRVQREVLYEALVRIEGLLRDAEGIIVDLLTPHLTSKNLFRISSAFGILADAKFLSRVFVDETLDEELEKLIDAMEYYTQFHYN